MSDGPKSTRGGAAPASARPTQQPPFDPDEFARESETSIEAAPESRRPTLPPAPRHDQLRESCRDLRAARPSGIVVAEFQSTPTLGAVAVLRASRDELGWFDLDPVARRLIDIIDGEMIVEEILALAHVDIEQGLAIFAQLADQHIVAFRAP